MPLRLFGIGLYLELGLLLLIYGPGTDPPTTGQQAVVNKLVLA